MQVLAILSRSTKQGISTFRFVETENNELWMFGGATPKAIQFQSRKDMDRCVMQWIQYGYTFGLVPVKKDVKPVNTQKSELPADLQRDLWSLPAPASVA